MLRRVEEKLLTEIQPRNSLRASREYRESTAPVALTRTIRRACGPGGNAVKIAFCLNGENRTEEVAGGEMLIDLLRDRLHVRSVKRGCENAECGACTVLVNGLARQRLHLSGGAYRRENGHDA